MANRNVMLIAAGGAAAIGAYVFFPGGAPKSNIFETDGVKNVGNAFSSGGGTTTHTPGYATKRGQSSGDSSVNVSSQQQMKGVGTPYFEENHAAQKAGEPGAVEKAFKSAHYGSEKGK